MKKKLVLVTIIMTLMILISVISNAADVKSLIFSSDKDEITRGESVQFTISSSELTGIEGTLKYDKNVWSVESKSSDYSFTINEETGKFVLVNLSGKEEIEAKIILKSSKDTKESSSKIEILDIIGSNSTGEKYEISDKSITIKFLEDKSDKKEQESDQISPRWIPRTGAGITIYAAGAVLIICAIVAYIIVNQKRKDNK